VASAIWTDGTAADAVTNAYTYDARELLTGLTQTLGTGTNTAISRSYDAQADLTSETVSLNGITESTFNQTWNAAGRRSNLAAQNTAMSWAFGYQADGQMTGVTANNRNYNFAYDLNGLLTSRSNPWRTQQFIQRDANGRPRVVTDTVGPSTALTEVLTYRPDSKISSYTATRQGNGAWNEARGFVYNSRGQLISEGLGLTSGATVTDTHSYDANGLGVHIGSVLSQGSTNNWSTTLDAFSRPLIETANINGATVHASGLAVGSSSLGVTLNSVSQGGAVFDPRSPDGKWKLDLGVPTGNNTVVATGTLPISGSTTSATNTFNVLANEATTNSYDAAGNLFSRNLTGPRTQNLTWDGLGRLVNVRQVDTNNCGLSFASIYDGLGRRIRTIQNTLASNTNVAGSTVTIDYFHDPQVEFLDLGVAVNGARTWKVYGPDLSGGYGALQGIGGLESTIRESDGQTVAFITDAFGNTLGTSPLWNQVNWTAMRFGSFGPVESFQPLSLSPSVSVSDASLHRGKIMDPTGLYCYGARFVTAHGVLISPDPMGFTASLGGLYEYGRNDLVNNVDPDGRFALGAWHGISVRFAEVFQNQDPNAIDHEMDVGSTAFRLGYQAGYYSPEIASVVVPEVLGAAFAEVGIAAARVARGVEGATMAVEALDEGALASEALVEGRAAVGAAEDVASALAEREALRQRVLANLSESAESRKSTGFADYLAGEANDANAAKTAPIRSNADLVTEIVSRADDWGTGQGLGLGPRAGSLKHGYADRLLTRYQRLYGDRGLSTEVPYLNGQSGVGGRGSIRLDVVEGALDNPTAIFDYKFGGAVLTPERIQQIRRVGQFGPNVPITAVHP
jgi:RHS repeat-associated protein